MCRACRPLASDDTPAIRCPAAPRSFRRRSAPPGRAARQRARCGSRNTSIPAGGQRRGAPAARRADRTDRELPRLATCLIQRRQRGHRRARACVRITSPARRVRRVQQTAGRDARRSANSCSRHRSSASPRSKLERGVDRPSTAVRCARRRNRPGYERARGIDSAALSSSPASTDYAPGAAAAATREHADDPGSGERLAAWRCGPCGTSTSAVAGPGSVAAQRSALPRDLLRQLARDERRQQDQEERRRRAAADEQHREVA